MKTSGYVQNAAGKGKLVRDKIANVIELAEKNGLPINAVDATLVVKSLREGNSLGYEARVKAEHLVERIDREAAINVLHKEIERLEAEGPMAIMGRIIGEVKADLDEWFEKAKSDPYCSFAWGNEAVKAAARLKVYGRIRLMLEGSETAEGWEDVLDEVREDALRKASSPPRSTSPMSNVVEGYETEVMAEVARGQDSKVRWVSFWFARKAEVERVVSELNIII